MKEKASQQMSQALISLKNYRPLIFPCQEDESLKGLTKICFKGQHKSSNLNLEKSLRTIYHKFQVLRRVIPQFSRLEAGTHQYSLNQKKVKETIEKFLVKRKLSLKHVLLLLEKLQ